MRPHAGTISLFSALFISLILIISAVPAWAALPAGTIISNTASAAYTDGASATVLHADSNTSSVTLQAMRTPSAIEFLQYAAGSPAAQNIVMAPTTECMSSATGTFVALPAPQHTVPGAGPVPINLAVPVPLAAAAQFHGGEPVFVRVTDLDQNIDPAVQETILVTVTNAAAGDVEQLRLTETGVNTGVFIGYIQTGPVPAAPGNAVLNVTYGSAISATYTDAVDTADSRSAAALVDPTGMVFSSRTGQPVDGVKVEIINAATGLPATVYGDDGISAFPASVTTGQSAADNSGKTYVFSAGVYRFPFVAPGQYRLVVTPPANYRFPSGVPDPVLQSLPGAPFSLANPGSRGEIFIVNPGPVIRIDIPVDPVSTALWLVKTAGKQTAGVGDFVPYQLSVENTGASATAPGVSVLDRLPAGFRYRKGSTRINGSAAPDPSISPDGLSLTFDVGDLSAGKTADVTFVTEVGAGAKSGNAKNIATASSVDGGASNLATATIEVIEELFRSRATIAGRVIPDGCDDSAASDPRKAHLLEMMRRYGIDTSAVDADGVQGIRLFLEDGTYVVTDKDGKFHFEAVRPGTHVVQVDTETLPAQYELLSCGQNDSLAETGFSRFVDIEGGSLWRVDFHLGLKPSSTGEAGIELRSALSRGEKPDRNRIEYAVPVHVGRIPLSNLRLIVTLPEGAEFQAGSSRLSGSAVPDPSMAEGIATFRLGDVPGDWDGTLRFSATVPVDGEVGELVTQAGLVFDSPSGRNERTPPVDTLLSRQVVDAPQVLPDIVLHPRFGVLSASLSNKDRKALDRVLNDLKRKNVSMLTITGHSDTSGIRDAGKKKFKDNYALSRARAETVGRYMAAALKLSTDQVLIVGKGPDQPVASNRTAKGRARNRRVEIEVSSRTELESKKESSGMKAVATVGVRPGEQAAGEDNRVPERKPDEATDIGSMVETASPGLAWILPESEYPHLPAVRIAVKHDPMNKLTLVLNGEPLNELNFDGMFRRADNTVAISTWRGVLLRDGDNLLEAVERNRDGAETARINRTLHYSSPPVKGELAAGQSRLVADGRVSPVIAVLLTDKDGKPARQGVVGEYSVDPPYVSRQRYEDLQKNPLAPASADTLKFVIGPGGIARIELQPTTRTGEAVIRIPLVSGVQEVRAWLAPEKRDWILVGLAEGTAGYNTVKGNMETLIASGRDEDFYDEGRLAFYAKGTIKGEWLLTAAYDSFRDTGPRKSMYQTVDPNKYYLLYGDAAEQRHDAATAKHLYIKLERDQFYALFGDYATGLTVTELSRYNRNMTGFKSEYKGERLEYTLFAADTDQAYIRDEIRGDGTSGLYRLSRRNIVINSERVTIEARDRFRSEVVVSATQLTRNLDYTIDSEAGTLFFKSPVASRDESFNPVFIVVEYETFDPDNTAYTYGGRAAVKTPDNRAQVGVTGVHEGTIGAEGDLTGVDTSIQIDQATKARAEAASTKTDGLDAPRKGTAYLAEVRHLSQGIDGRVYVREQESGFGLGQQNGSESGTRKFGGSFAYHTGRPWTVSAEAFKQENLSTVADRVMAEARVGYALPRYELFTGLRHAEDSLSDGSNHRSEQLFAGARYRFTDSLTGRIQHDETLNDSAANVDFPTRTTVGLDYRLTQNATLFADHERARGVNDTEMTRAGIKTTPWTGAQMNSAMEQQLTENGARLFSTTGLKQGWQITKEWSVDAGLDRSATVRNTASYQFNPNVPPASGGAEDFTAVFLGAGYRQETWSWTSRIEKRRSDVEERFSTFMGANGEVKPGFALAAGLQTFRTTAPGDVLRFNGDLRVAAAYRPAETRVIVLDRADYLRSEQRGAGLSYDNWRLVNNLVANYKLDGRSQLSFQYASKYVGETIEQCDYRGYTDLTGIEYRHDVSRNWDIGLGGSRLHSWALHQADYGASLSVGFTAARNLWVSIGYNLAGFTDREFSKSEFTAKGPFVKLRLKFDQVSVRDGVKWVAGQ